MRTKSRVASKQQVKTQVHTFTIQMTYFPKIKLTFSPDTIILKRILIFLTILSVLAPLRAQDLNKSLFKKKNRIDIPFDYINGFIVLKINFGPGIPLHFIFDTGAEYSILAYQEIAYLSQAKIGRQIFIYGADMKTKIPANILQHTKLEIAGKITFENIDMILLRNNLLDFDKYVGIPIHGILGANYFSRFVVEINYARQIISFHNPNTFFNYKNYTQIPTIFRSRKPFFSMEVEMPNGQKFMGKFLLDCGANLSAVMILGSHEALAKPEHALVSRIATGLGGNMDGYIGKVKSIRLSDHLLKKPIVHFQQLTDSLVFFNQKNGLVGNRILSLYHILIDYPNNQLYIKPTKKRALKTRPDRSGLFLIASGSSLKKITVEQVLEESPAAIAGLKNGDQILKINHWPVKLLDLETITSKFKKRIGKKIKLTILRDGQKIKYAFRLNDFI